MQLNSFRELSLDEQDLACGGASNIRRLPMTEPGVLPLEVEPIGPHTLSQANRAGIEEANEIMRSDPLIDRVDLDIRSQDPDGTNWATRGGWSREDMMRTPNLDDISPPRPLQGDFNVEELPRYASTEEPTPPATDETASSPVETASAPVESGETFEE